MIAHALLGPRFVRWVGQKVYAETGRVHTGRAIQEVLNILAAEADARPAQDVFVRVAGVDDEVVLDLGRDDERVVVIKAGGWSTTSQCAIKFRRPKGIGPLPLPERGGSIRALRRFINCTDEDWPLVLGYLMSVLYGRGPFPMLVLVGEQGSAKTTTVKVIKALVDPGAAGLRSEPREIRDLVIAASNSWLLAFDNLSFIPQWLSDALCRLATGGGFATRALYTNDEEAIFDVMRPAAATGIEDIVTRADLLDRAVIINAPRISDDRRCTDRDLWSAFERERPLILGALLDAVSSGLGRLPNTRLEKPPRMADFATWVTACEPSLGIADGAFLAAYGRNIEDAVATAIDLNPIAQALSAMLARPSQKGVFEGPAQRLLDTLNANPQDRSVGWPKSARSLSGHLRRLAPNLRAHGIEIDFSRSGSQRLVRVRRQPSHRHPSSLLPSHANGRGEASCGGSDGSDGCSALSAHPEDKERKVIRELDGGSGDGRQADGDGCDGGLCPKDQRAPCRDPSGASGATSTSEVGESGNMAVAQRLRAFEELMVRKSRAAGESANVRSVEDADRPSQPSQPSQGGQS